MGQPHQPIHTKITTWSDDWEHDIVSEHDAGGAKHAHHCVITVEEAAAHQTGGLGQWVCRPRIHIHQGIAGVKWVSVTFLPHMAELNVMEACIACKKIQIKNYSTNKDKEIVYNFNKSRKLPNDLD